MNTKEMLRMLSEYFSEFECHVAFLEEFYNILRKNVSGKEKLLFKQLAAQLENIKKGSCIDTFLDCLSISNNEMEN